MVQILESMCKLDVAIDCSVVYRFVCVTGSARAWAIAEELFASACAAVGMPALCVPRRADLSSMSPDLRALCDRVRVCCESELVLPRRQLERQDGDYMEFAPCCDAMLAVYAHATPVQVDRARFLITAMVRCVSSHPRAEIVILRIE